MFDHRLKMRRLSLHADILNQRHTSTSLAELVPMDWLTEADFFLYLRSIFSKTNGEMQFPKFWSLRSAHLPQVIDIKGLTNDTFYYCQIHKLTPMSQELQQLTASNSREMCGT